MNSTRKSTKSSNRSPNSTFGRSFYNGKTTNETTRLTKTTFNSPNRHNLTGNSNEFFEFNNSSKEEENEEILENL